MRNGKNTMKTTLLGAAALLMSTGVATAQARVTLAENADLSSKTIISDSGVPPVGQSFTVTGTPGTSYNGINFTFLTGKTNTNFATGTLYLFSSAYTGTLAGLPSGGNLLGSATAIGNLFTFLPTFALQSGTQYFAYANTNQTVNDSFDYVGGNYSGGDGFFYSATSFYADGYGGDISFRATGIAVPAVVVPAAGVPEAATWAMMIAGFGIAGVALRRRKAMTVVAFS